MSDISDEFRFRRRLPRPDDRRRRLHCELEKARWELEVAYEEIEYLKRLVVGHCPACVCFDKGHCTQGFTMSYRCDYWVGGKV